MRKYNSKTTNLAPKRKLTDAASEKVQKPVKSAKNPAKKQKTEMGNLFSSSKNSSSTSKQETGVSKIRATKVKSLVLPKTAVSKIHIQKHDRTAAWVDETVSPERILAPKIHETSEISGYLSEKYGRRPW